MTTNDNPISTLSGGDSSKYGETRGRILSLLPGLALVTTITAAAYGLRSLPGLSPLSPIILGVFIGVVLGNVAPLQHQFEAGVAICGKGLLRAAVALLGLQVTVGQLLGIGAWGLFSAAFVLFVTFLATLAIGRMMNVATPLTVLIASGTSVCGAAAIAGANGAIRAPDEDVTYAIGCITLFGTIAMFAYPVIGHLLDLEARQYGLWIGLSVHEVAQVVGAGFQGGEEAGQTAVIAKLARVLLLAVLVFSLALRFTIVDESGEGGRGGPATRPPLVPVFIIVFLLFCLANSAGLVPERLRLALVEATPVVLTAALAALGLGTRFDRLRRLGLKPLVLCAMATGLIAVLSFILAVG